jgi:hypothetical protein
MSHKASQLWLSALEDLPPHSLIIFTTNNANKFSDRFVDRCEYFAFAGRVEALESSAYDLIDRIWAAEIGDGQPPQLRHLGNVTDGSGQISFRRIVRALEPAIRERRIEGARRDATFDPSRARLNAQVVARRVKPVETMMTTPVVIEAQGDVKTPAEQPVTDLNSIDWPTVARRYVAGEGLTQLGRSLGVPSSSVHGRLKRLGVSFGRDRRIAQ